MRKCARRGRLVGRGAIPRASSKWTAASAKERARLVDAGANVLVMGNAVFGAADPGGALQHIRLILR